MIEGHGIVVSSSSAQNRVHVRRSVSQHAHRSIERARNRIVSQPLITSTGRMNAHRRADMIPCTREVATMVRTEEWRDDPSAGKSGASPSDSGSGEKSRTVFADPTTGTRPDPEKIPQASPAPDAIKDLETAREPQHRTAPTKER
jgi:hypothetical protein